jgi:predicted secreted protein
VTATWDASPPSDQITGYQVCIGTAAGSCSIQLASVSDSQTSYTFTPTAGVLHHVAVRAVNASGPGSYSSEAVFSVPSFAQPVNQSNAVGAAITPLTFTVTDPDGGTLNFTHTGLPTGLTLNSSTGRVSGTPSAAGTYNVTIYVNDGLVTVSRSFVWTITQAATDTTAPALSITSHTNGQTLTSASVTLAGTATDSGRGGNGIASVTVNGLGATGGTVTGSATASWTRALTLSAGANTITVDASDTKGNIATQTITLNYTVAPVTSATLTSSVATPQNTNTAITFTAAAAGGVGPRQFKFFVQPSGGSAQMVRDWSTTTTYAWTPTTAASYTVIVWARSAGVTTDAAQASAQMAYVINTPPPAPVSGATLTSSVATPQETGTSITFTAAGTGGVGPRQFKFLVQPSGGTVQVAQSWSTATTYTWTPSTAGTYTVTVWARSAGVTTDAAQASAQMAYVITTPPPSPVTSATLTSNVATPQDAGTAITFTAAGFGGVGPRQFKFLVQPAGGSVQVAQTWSTATTYTWTPSTAGTYTVTVWARSAGVTTDAAQASAQMAYVINTPPPAPVTSATLVSNVATPQNTNTAITFTATGIGGVGPRQFKFFVQPSGGSPQMVRDWSTTRTYAWTPTIAGNYTIIVWARSAGVTTDAAQASAQMAFVINTPPPTPVTSATLTSNVATPQETGTAITFSAAATGGVGPREFKFFVRQGTGTTQVAQDWSTTATYAWTPLTAASYTVTVWARSAGVTADAAQASAQMSYVITTPPPAAVTSATLTSNVATPQDAGTAITFTAAGVGGVGPRQFKFFVQLAGGSVQVAQNWSTATTYTWKPSIAGTYTVTVWARSAGVTTDAAQASAQMAYVINTPPPAAVSTAGLTPNMPSPQVTDTTVTFAATASGGVGPRQFKFLVQAGGGAALVAQNWSTAATYAWRPTIAGTYTITVWARSAGVTADAPQASAQVSYSIDAPAAPLSITSLTSTLASPRVIGTSIGFNAVATGGQAPYQFKWWVFDGASWKVGREWSTSASFNWQPTAPGEYLVAVWARNNGVTANQSQALAQVAYTITAAAPTAPLEVSSLTSNVASPQIAGTTITFNAVATGGQSPYQFKWWVFDGATWRVAQNWSTNATLSWRPTVPGDYTVAVWARNNGVSVDASQALAQVSYTITAALSSAAPTAPLEVSSLTSNVASPQIAGTTITFNAVATGGQSPYQFKWWVFDGATWRVAQNWSTNATLSWRPTVPGDYTVAVWARNNGVSVDASQALAQVSYRITGAMSSSAAPAAPLSIDMTSNATSPSLLGTSVTFTAVGNGGTAPYQFKWWVFDGTSWQIAQEWSAAATFTWRPTKVGSYLVAVWGRSNGVKANQSEALAQTSYTILGTAASQPLAITSFTSNLTSPQAANSTVTFSTSATGGTAPYEYKWWVFDGTSWSIGQNWSSNATFAWHPKKSGTYMVAVWVRNAGVKADASQALAQSTYIIN